MFIDIHTHSRIKKDSCISLSSYRYGQEAISFDMDSSILTCAAIHPWDVNCQDLISELERIAPQLFAMSEMGLDRLHEDYEGQKHLFVSQLDIASRYNKVVIIHAVRSHEEVIAILKGRDTKHIIHSFVGSREIADRYINIGCYISISPMSLLSPKTVIAIKSLPLSHIFIESDDTAEDIINIYIQVAKVLEISVTELEQQVFNNFKTIFKDEFLRKNRVTTR